VIYGTINYWECPVDVEGTVKGKKVRGTGYMELVGYPSDYNYLVLAGKELNAKLREALLSRLHRPRFRFAFKPSYIIIPLITVLVSVIGSSFTSSGIGSGWYASIAKPAWTPPGSVIGAVWTTIFILTTISAILVWRKAKRDSRFWWIIGLFIANALLNIFWSFLFFGRAMIGPAVWEAALLDATVIALVILIWRTSRIASLLLVPYAAWVAFATYLTYSVWRLN
jgi:benzodiazapine receptor